MKQNGVPGMPMTTKQPPQQSPPTRNTFTSTQAAVLSTMKNQHKPTTEGENEEKIMEA